MRKAYDEVMDKINVTPEMRQRVLKHIAEEGIKPAHPKILPFSGFRKYLSLAACLIFLVAGAATLPHLVNLTTPEPPPIQIPQNITEAGSLQELSALVGFNVKADFSFPFIVEETTYCSYWGELAQITYTGKEHTAIYRQSIGAEDNSGNFSSYADVKEVHVDEMTITIKGNAENYVLAIWTDGTYSYSISLNQGIAAAEWLDILVGH